MQPACQKILGNAKASNELKDMLKSSLNELAKYCWLMCIANPPLLVKFDVVGKPFDDIKERFEKYSTTDELQQSDFNAGCVHLVVWPSLETEGGGVYHKREVIVVPQSLGSRV